MSTGLCSNFYQRWCNCNGVTFYLECTLLPFTEHQPTLFKYQAQFIKVTHCAFPGMYLKPCASAYEVPRDPCSGKHSDSEVRNIPSALIAMLAVSPPHA